jgi:hypothetical protein
MLCSLKMGNFIIEIHQEDEHLTIDTFVKQPNKECISSGYIIIKKEKTKQVEINEPPC